MNDDRTIRDRLAEALFDGVNYVGAWREVWHNDDYWLARADAFLAALPAAGLAIILAKEPTTNV